MENDINSSVGLYFGHTIKIHELNYAYIFYGGACQPKRKFAKFVFCILIFFLDLVSIFFLYHVKIK